MVHIHTHRQNIHTHFLKIFKNVFLNETIVAKLQVKWSKMLDNNEFRSSGQGLIEIRISVPGVGYFPES